MFKFRCWARRILYGVFGEPCIRGPYGRYWPREDVVNATFPGWRDLTDRLIWDLFVFGWDGRLSQIKDKYGRLCFYIGYANAAVWERIRQAEIESARTCEECGAPATQVGRAWTHTVCEEHAYGRKAAA